MSCGMPAWAAFVSHLQPQSPQLHGTGHAVLNKPSLQPRRAAHAFNFGLRVKPPPQGLRG